MGVLSFAPQFSVRLHPIVFVEHGAHEMSQLLRGCGSKQNVDDLAILSSEAQPGHSHALVDDVFSTFDHARDQGNFIAHWKMILSFVCGYANVTEAGVAEQRPGGGFPQSDSGEAA